MHDNELTEKQEQAFRLRLRGASYRQIAAAMGISVATAHAHVKAALRNTSSTVESLEELRAIELARLDRALMAIWPEIEATGDHINEEYRDKAINRFLQISKRRAELTGLDAPTQVDITRHLRERAAAEGLSYEELMAEVEAILAAGSE